VEDEVKSILSEGHLFDFQSSPEFTTMLASIGFEGENGENQNDEKKSASGLGSTALKPIPHYPIQRRNKTTTHVQWEDGKKENYEPNTPKRLRTVGIAPGFSSSDDSDSGSSSSSVSSDSDYASGGHGADAPTTHASSNDGKPDLEAGKAADDGKGADKSSVPLSTSPDHYRLGAPGSPLSATTNHSRVSSPDPSASLLSRRSTSGA
jgi:hypothetical protein